jgi:SAM-dependent methyltransferase
MAKPFGSITGTPDLLYGLGILIHGLRLGRSMRVIDFGSGSCWLSRCLAQLGCATISLDVSPAALDIGRRLFASHPILGELAAEPQFLLYDGTAIPLSDGSVDRIVCFDSFHHVPNPAAVLAEFHRVLRDGGIVGFVEPGRHHSRAESSRREIEIHGVVERDIKLEEIRRDARLAGFTRLEPKLSIGPDTYLSYEHHSIITRHQLWRLLNPVTLLKTFTAARRIARGITNHSVFFLHKGSPRPDTRSCTVAQGGDPASSEARDLAGTITLAQGEGAWRDVKTGDSVRFDVSLSNSGTVIWLRENFGDYAVVRLGVHLLDGDGATIDHDYARFDLPADLPPGSGVTLPVTLTVPDPGRHTFVLDLVCEGVCWFEQVGSTPLRVTVEAG